MLKGAAYRQYFFINWNHNLLCTSSLLSLILSQKIDFDVQCDVYIGV